MPIGPRGTSNYWQDWANLAVGGWLFLAPWILAYDHVRGAGWNSWICGLVIVVVSAAALILFTPWQEWANAIIGLWLLVSPWVMGFAGTENAAALWNHLLVGLVVGGLALWDALAHGSEDKQVV